MNDLNYGRPVSEVWVTPGGSIEASVPGVLEAVILYPLGAPLPPEAHKLSGDPAARFYDRLAPLAEADGGLALVPLSGPELHSLVTAWPNLVGRKVVYNLIGLPGQLTDPIFAEASRAIGLKAVPWADVAREIETARAVTQSEADSHPWSSDGSFDFGKPAIAEPTDPRQPSAGAGEGDASERAKAAKTFSSRRVDG